MNATSWHAQKPEPADQKPVLAEIVLIGKNRTQLRSDLVPVGS